MKLINEKSFYLFTAYFIIFVVVGFLFYYTVETIIFFDYKEKLQYRKIYTIKQLEDSDSLLAYSKFSGYTLSISPIEPVSSTEEVFSDTIIYDEVENKYTAFRQLKFYHTVRGKTYKISVRRSLIETEEIIQGLVVVTSVVFLILLLTLIMVNKWISKRVWLPFYHTLENIKRYQVGKFHDIELPETNIQEFKELISVLNILMNKISADFLALKEFTENISHEVQTPLSIIKSKLELLMQSEKISDQEIDLVSSSYQAANRLSKLAEALSLLTKIENYQFTDSRTVNFNQLLENRFQAYEELTEMKSISIVKDVQDVFTHSIDPALADILIENLVVNSIKHNVKGGEIFYQVTKTEICISNSGNKLKVDPEELFQRFTKSNSESLGLGLSIVKKICFINNLEVKYTYDSNTHRVCISKPS